MRSWCSDVGARDRADTGQVSSPLRANAVDPPDGSAWLPSPIPGAVHYRPRSVKGARTMPARNLPARPEPAYLATIHGSVLDDETHGQVVVTTVPVFSRTLAAHSALLGESECADRTYVHRVAVEGTGRVYFGRADAIRLAAAVVLAVTDTMDHGRLRHGDAVRLVYVINDLRRVLTQLHDQTIDAVQRSASAIDDPPVS